MTGHSGPVEPSADLRMAASAARQMFAALVAEGFTEAQALVLLGTMMSGQRPSP